MATHASTAADPHSTQICAGEVETSFYPGGVPDHDAVRRVSRRGLLGVGAGLALGSIAGCSPPSTLGPGRATCVARDALDQHRSLGGAPLIYEVDQRPSRFWFEAAFFVQLERWADSVGGVWGSPVDRWFTYGSWTDGSGACDSWHDSGRAFDLARLRLEDGTTVSCRYDQWKSAKPAAVARARRAYWRLAAGLHAQFAYVLTYLYDAAHANHIHVDNGRSGGQLSEFSSRSRVQVQAVQAICRYVWDEPVELTGHWDRPTRQASQRVLDRVGPGGSVDDGTGGWRAFLEVSANAEPR